MCQETNTKIWIWELSGKRYSPAVVCLGARRVVRFGAEVDQCDYYAGADKRQVQRERQISRYVG